MKFRRICKGVYLGVYVELGNSVSKQEEKNQSRKYLKAIET